MGFCVYTVQPKNVVTKNDFIGCAVIKIADLVTDNNLSVELDGKAGAKLTFKCKVTQKKEKKKEEKKPAEPKISKEEQKKIKLALKEGGKKGQDLCGMSTFGVHHFMPAMDSPEGRWDLLELCMEGMNKPVN